LAINYKVGPNVAAYLRCDGLVNNQIKKGLLLQSVSEFFFKWVNIWQIYKQERDCLVHFVRLANTVVKTEKTETWFMPSPILQMGLEALCFRVVPPSLRACVPGSRHSPTGLPSTSSCSFVHLSAESLKSRGRNCAQSTLGVF